MTTEFDADQAYSEIEKLQLLLAKTGDPNLAVANPSFNIIEAALKSGIVILRNFCDDLRESYATLNENIMRDPRILDVEEFAEALETPCPSAMDFLNALSFKHDIKENDVFTYFQFGGYQGDPGSEGLDAEWSWAIKENDIIMLEFSDIDYVVAQFRS